MPHVLNIASIVSRFYVPLYRFALSLTKSEAEAADLTQQTFFILARRSDQIRDVSKVKCWLFTTLRHEFLLSVRLQSNHPHVELRPDIYDSPSVPSDAERALDAKFVVEALSCVEKPYRIALELFYLGELSYKEVAHALEVPIGTVMSRLSRGKDQLKALLAAAISESKTTIISYREMKESQIQMIRGAKRQLSSSLAAQAERHF